MGKMIELSASDGHKLAAYRTEPKGKPSGALIVVQEIFGVNSHIKSVADGYAADGYLAIAPAFFDRAQRGVDLGYTQADKSAGKVGIVGYCWGGTVAWMAAARLAGLSCSVCYYGGGIPNNAGEKPKCPVMFHWGETDQSIPIEAAKKAAAQHPSAQSFIYKAGHGFNCDQRGSYHAESAKLARSRSLEFLRKNIG